MAASITFTFDNMGAARDIGLGIRAAPDRGAHEETAGYPWLLDLLAETAIPATFFIEGWNAIHHRSRVVDLVERGHDVGLHGWVHERWDELSDHDVERLLHDGTAALRQCGAASTSFRAPGGTTTGWTRRVLGELGYVIDASIAEDGPSPLGLLSVPFEWELVDADYYLDVPLDDQASVERMEAYWLSAFDNAAATDANLVVVAHALLSGASEPRQSTFERLLHSAINNPDLDVVSLAETANRLI